MLGRQIVEKGTVTIKRPGRMLWEYLEPEKKVFVSDGRQIFFYVPADKQVIRRDQPGDKGVALSLLSGQADLLSQFDVDSGAERRRAGRGCGSRRRSPTPRWSGCFSRPTRRTASGRST